MDEPGGTDDRARRKMGDATMGRIADLASGWEVPPEAKGTATPPAPAAPPTPAAGAKPAPPPATPPAPPAPRAARADEQPVVAGELPRKKSRTAPPPPPGSPLRTKPPTVPVPIAEVARVTAAATAAPTANEPSVPLPLPAPPGTGPVAGPAAPARTKPPSRPPPPPVVAKPAPVGDEDELTIPADSLPPEPAPLAPPPRLGDSGFDEAQKATVAADPSRGVMKRILEATPIPGPAMRPSAPGFEAAQATVVDPAPPGLRDAAVIEGPRGQRGDPTVVPTGDDDRAPRRGDLTGVSTSPFERADPTGVESAPREDATASSVPAVGLTASIRLRDEVTLPRRRGVLGDVRYVFTVLLGTARARREAVTVGQAISRQLAERKERLVALGRAAVASDKLDHPALSAARDKLGEIEEERSRHAGALAAGDEELDHVRRERAKRAGQTAAAITEKKAEIAAIAAKLLPLEKQAVAARRRVGDLAEQLRRIDTRIRATEGRLSSIKTKKEDRAAVQADLATLKADRAAVQRDEPALAIELDRLTPKMAALEAEHHDALARITDLEEDEAADVARAAELVAAIEAKQKVVTRARTDAERARDRALYALAERLLIDRPTQLGRAFEPIDELDMSIATSERRAMELRELIGSVDRGAVVRGVVVMAVVVGGAIAGVVLALSGAL